MSNLCSNPKNDRLYDQPNIAVTILFNIYVVIWWLEIGKRIPFFGAIRLEFILGALLSVCALSRFFRRKRLRETRSDIALWIFCLLVILFISLPLAENLGVAWSAYVNHVLKYALMAFFISQFVTSPETLKFFSFSSFFAFFKIGQEAMYGKLTGSQVWENQGIPRLHGTQGTMFGHPNSLSGKTVSLVPFLLYVFQVLKSKWIKIFILIQLIFSINIILFTGSRTGYITLFFMIVIMFFISQKKVVLFFLILLLGTVTIFTVPGVYTDRFISSFSGYEAQGRSKDARKGLFIDSLLVFAQNPLGVGLYCFPIVQEQAGRRVQETHNLYTQLLAETGIQGFIVFILFIRALLEKIYKLRKGFETCKKKLISLLSLSGEELGSRRDMIALRLEQNIFLYSITTGLFVFLLVRLVLGLFGHDFLEIYWWISAGLTMSLEKMLLVTISDVDKLSFPQCVAIVPHIETR